MGEYWKPINVTRKEYVHAHRVDNGLKLAEWANDGSAVLALCASWAPSDDIRIVSDYDGDIRVTAAAKSSTEEATYDTIEVDFEEISGSGKEGSSDVPALILQAAAPHIRYEDWHEEHADILSRKFTT